MYRFLSFPCCLGVLLFAVFVTQENGIRSTTALVAADANGKTQVDDEAGIEERKRFVGTWKVVRTEFEGNGETPKVRTADYFHFTESEVVDWIKGSTRGQYYQKYILRDKTTPHQFDRVAKGARDHFPGIYEWDGLRLRIAITDAEPIKDPRAIARKRPKSFKTTKKDASTFVLLLERVPEGEIAPPPRTNK